MKVSDAEKLILVMLSEVYDKLGIKNGEVDHGFIREAIYSGHTWALDWRLPGIVGDSPEPTPPAVKRVLDVLEMWDFIERSYESLSKAQKKDVDAQISPFRAVFDGFDGNNETDAWSIASFLVDQLDRYSRFKGRDLNSHSESTDRYLRMLAVFRPLRDKGTLSQEDLVLVLKAGEMA